MSSRAFHVSKNRLGGSLGETSVDKLLDSCGKHLITGTINIDTALASGRIELRAGGVDRAVFDGQQGEAALVQMRQLNNGTYELAQRLPELTGALGRAAECRGDLAQNSVIEIMRHCEDQALSCTITIVAEFDRAEITYRAGDITAVLFNGKPDEDSVVEVVKWKRGKFRVTVPPLALDIDGWPTTSKDPTIPFNIRDLAKMPLPPKKKQPARVAKGTPALPIAAVPQAPRVAPPPPPVARVAAKREAEPMIPSVESFHHAPRLDPSGQLTLRADTVVDRPQKAGSPLSLLALAVAMAGLWVTVALMVGAL